MIHQVAIDSRRVNSADALFVALKGEHHDGHDFIDQAAKKGAKFALVSKEWNPSLSPSSIQLLRVAQPLAALQEIAQCYRETLSAQFIAISGSFGKTMVKDLLLSLLNTQYSAGGSPESFNSQIGVPLSLFTINQSHSFAIIEAAISHKGEMDALAKMIRPNYSILTPIGKKHLATLNDLKTLSQELCKLIDAVPQQGWSLLPSEQLPFLSRVDNRFFWDQPSHLLPFAKRLSSNQKNYTLHFPNQESFSCTLPGYSAYYMNLINIAVQAAWLLDISAENIVRVLSQLREEPSRTELWSSPKGTHILNDTYCSDPQSVLRCLRFSNLSPAYKRKIFAFGGMRSQAPNILQEYGHIGEIFAAAKIDQLLLYGDNPFSTLIEAFKRDHPNGKIFSFADELTLIAYLNEQAKQDDLIFIKGERKVPFDVLIKGFHEGLSNNLLIINLSAIEANLKLLKHKLPKPTRIMGIIKAFAYGTGDARMAKYLPVCGVDILGVSYVDEGVILRQSGIDKPIFSINAAIYEIDKVVKWDLEVGVSNLVFLQELSKRAREEERCIKVHLHVNTGMGRFGCRPEEALMLAQFIVGQTHLKLEGVMTHFACADDPSQDPFTQTQIASFDSVIEQLQAQGIDPPWKHASNSSGAIRFYLPQYNMVRIGLALYGLHASESVEKASDLRLALSLTSRIVGINVCHKGESVSYGRSYRIEKEIGRIAILPIGYFDGFHRHYSGKASVLIAGQRAPMVGNICMDYMMIDVTDIENVNVGDPVLIFGEDESGNFLSPEGLAESGNSIIHELITCLGPRIQRIFVFEEGQQQR